MYVCACVCACVRACACVCVCVCWPWQDTVSADEEDDEVDADQHAREGRATVRHDAVVHHQVPVLSRQDLEEQQSQGTTDHNTLPLTPAWTSGGGISLSCILDYHKKCVEIKNAHTHKKIYNCFC